MIELRDAITKLVSIQMDRHKEDDNWRVHDNQVHETLIAKVARQSIFIGLGAAIFGTALGWLAALHMKIDNAEERITSHMEKIEQDLRRAHRDDQLRNDGHHFLRGQMEKQIGHNEAAIKDLERRVFGRAQTQE